jgi:acyl-CoA thioester hydrolase/1,4-dihydroxy-2-naphthoyl-CoA hydrolase
MESWAIKGDMKKTEKSIAYICILNERIINILIETFVLKKTMDKFTKKMRNIYTTYKRIEFADADPAGILFFGNIFRIAHSAFEEYLVKSGNYNNYFNGQKCIFPLVHCESDFVNPVKPGETVNISCRCSRIGNSSFELEYEVLKENEDGSGIVIARVRTVHAAVLKDLFKKTSIPEFLLRILKQE